MTRYLGRTPPLTRFSPGPCWTLLFTRLSAWAVPHLRGRCALAAMPPTTLWRIVPWLATTRSPPRIWSCHRLPALRGPPGRLLATGQRRFASPGTAEDVCSRVPVSTAMSVLRAIAIIVLRIARQRHLTLSSSAQLNARSQLSDFPSTVCCLDSVVCCVDLGSFLLFLVF